MKTIMSPDELKGKYYPVLDKGFVSLVDYMGNDAAIVQAARTSYGKGTKKISTDRGLIRYLVRHHHSTPLEMVELKFHIGMPMDHWRQKIRHRTASVNEYSTRYSEAIDATSETPPDQWRLQSDSNKQGSGGFLNDPDVANILSSREKELHKLSRQVYEERLQVGIAREQARKDLPLSTYTMAYWKCDLKNILGFLTLRCDSHAQLEIRAYANVMAAIAKVVAPATVEAWIDYSHCGANFSRQELMAISELVATGKMPDHERLSLFGLNKREITEFEDKVVKPVAPPDFDINLLKPYPAEHFSSMYGAEVGEE